ncbi:MAG: flagellar hook-basal body complex protein FliE [Gammaproteobacteria bacterium]|nr:flagellar hook-basal body complex protein FliE [Gammaproteobacteria bacterium]MBT8124073.1 flagellar hook-basal body complex protein FliE [Gammaproteobacteria bacterium]
MSDIKINELLSQIRSISSQVEPNINIKQDNNETMSFSSVLKTSVDKVNEQQMMASELANRFEQGDSSVELSRVMIEMQKARVSFEAVKQVRNQLVTAYQEVMSMPV